MSPKCMLNAQRLIYMVMLGYMYMKFNGSTSQFLSPILSAQLHKSH